jgi:hypothetical protein
MQEQRHQAHCMVCGSPLDYSRPPEERQCVYCGSTLTDRAVCSQGHFVCERCHGMNVRQHIEDISLTARENDPFVLAERMLSLPGLPMLGCEHALIACGAFLAALRNSPYGVNKITGAEIRDAFGRTEIQAKSGFCGLTGVCGIAPAIGACVSVFLGSRCGSDTEQRITMETVLRVQRAIADLTGPSCCKAYVRSALAEATGMFSERFGIMLPVATMLPRCRHSTLHPHGCREGRCPYYDAPTTDIFAESRFIPGIVCST